MSAANIGAGAAATQGSVAAHITVGGNVAGDIIVGNNNFKVNTNYGTIVYQQAGPQVKLRDAVPQPPRAPRGFVGRTNELTRLNQLITSNEAVTLYGLDGTGKSTLLRQAAIGNQARAKPNGVVLIEGIDGDGQALGADDVVQRLFDALFESDPPLKVNATTARTYLSNTQPLVILDGLNLPAAALSALPDLIPQGALFVTSNRAPAGEALQPLKLGPLTRDEAIELLTARTGLTVDENNRSTLDAIGALLGDVPLAIVTAANAIRESSLALEHARSILAATTAQSTDSVRSGVERAWALVKSTLSEHERQILALVANTPGVSIDPDSIKAMLDNADWVDAALERLQAIGLLRANSPRRRLDPGLRDLLRADEAATRDRLIVYLSRMLRVNSLDWTFVADELGNILGAVEWAAGQSRWSDVITLGRAVDPYLTLHGLWDAWAETLSRVLQAARALRDRATEAWALHQLGTRAIGVDLRDQAIELLRTALDLRRTLGDSIGMAYTQHNLDLLIPPVPPRRGQMGRPPLAGLSGIVKLVLGLAIVGAIALGGYALLRASRPEGVVPLPTAEPTQVSAAQPTALSVHTSTPQLVPTNTPTPTPTATPTPTPAPLIWPIVFFSGGNPKSGYEVFTINSDGSNRTQITKGLPEQPAAGLCSFRAGAATLSPNGKQIAYTQYTQNSDLVVTSFLYLMNADGTDLNAVTKAQGYISQPSWSPDGTQVAVGIFANEKAFIQIFDHTGRLLSTVDLKGSFVDYFFQISWSPDSKRIAFSGDIPNNIFVTNADGSREVQLTKENRGAILPAWSPDGKRIAFRVSGDSGAEIRVISSDGAPLTTITTNASFLTEFAWSPDSTHLAFSTDSPDEQSISVADVNSGKVTRLVDHLGSVFGPVWSPDGQQIAFTSFNTKSFDDIRGGLSIYGGPARSDIYVVNADGSGLLNLTNTPNEDDFMSYPIICAQCPYVYTYDVGQKNWAYDTTILYKLVGKENETLQTRALKNFDGRLLIREVEPETSFIDQAYVVVVDGDGRVIRLPAQLDRLREADGNYLVMHTGDELLLTFEGFDQIHLPQQVSVVAKGYYVPLQSSSTTAP